jgi:hypothetical protein
VSLFFWLAEEFFWAWWRVGFMGFLLGVFDKFGGWHGVFCGQSVVNCVVKMVN